MNNKWLRVGIEVEKEHTKDEEKARKIAMDHLAEDPDYYKDWKNKEKILFQPKAPSIKKAISHLLLVKSLRKSEEFQKAGSQGLPVGTIRIWHGQKFIKQPDGHWVPLSADQGTGQSASQGSTAPVAESAQQEESSQAVATENEGVESSLDKIEASESTDHLKPGKEGGEVSITMPDLKAMLEKGPYSIISAGTNPKDEKDRGMTEAQVSERYKQLEEDLKAAGMKYTVVDGNYDGEEKSYMVFHADPKKIEELGKKYNQDSVVHMKDGKNTMAFTTGDNAGKSHTGEGWTEVPDADNYYSVVKTKEGEPVKFSMDFDFGNFGSEEAKSDESEEKPAEEPKEDKTEPSKDK